MLGEDDELAVGILRSRITYDNEVIYARGFIVDTNAYNYSRLMSIRDSRLYATHVQLDEILNISGTARGRALLDVFMRITDFIIPTAGCVLDVSRLDACFMDDDEQWLKEALAMHIERDGKFKPVNQVRDVLIMRTCQATNKVLITYDKKLKELAESSGVEVEIP